MTTNRLRSITTIVLLGLASPALVSAAATSGWKPEPLAPEVEIAECLDRGRLRGRHGDGRALPAGGSE